MRRLAAQVAPFAVAVALLVPAAQAAPAPQLTDPKGDWQTAGQDVLWGRLSSVRGDRGPEVRGELRLAAPPTVPGTVYRFAFTFDDCHEYSFAYQVPGAADSRPALNPTQPGMNYSDRCDDVPGPDTSYAVSAVVTGDTIVWQAPYVGHIQRGAIVRTFAGLACASATCGLGVVPAGDLAAATGRYVMGSDLPRR
jgi:hypothetical protein